MRKSGKYITGKNNGLERDLKSKSSAKENKSSDKKSKVSPYDDGLTDSKRIKLEIESKRDYDVLKSTPRNE